MKVRTRVKIFPFSWAAGVETDQTTFTIESRRELFAAPHVTHVTSKKPIYAKEAEMCKRTDKHSLKDTVVLAKSPP